VSGALGRRARPDTAANSTSPARSAAFFRPAMGWFVNWKVRFLFFEFHFSVLGGC